MKEVTDRHVIITAKETVLPDNAPAFSALSPFMRGIVTALRAGKVIRVGTDKIFRSGAAYIVEGRRGRVPFLDPDAAYKNAKFFQ